MTRYFLAAALGAMFCLASTAQTPAPHPRKLLTSEQQVYQAAWNRWLAAQNQRRTAAHAILDRIPPQPHGGDCPQAMSTYAAVQCLGALDQSIAADEVALVAALHALASNGEPSFPGQTPMPGEQSPKQRAARLETLESEWLTYRKAAVEAAHAEGEGGTIGPILALSTDLFLLRSHIGELSSLYGDTLLSSH